MESKFITDGQGKALNEALCPGETQKSKIEEVIAPFEEHLPSTVARRASVWRQRSAAGALSFAPLLIGITVCLSMAVKRHLIHDLVGFSLFLSLAVACMMLLMVIVKLKPGKTDPIHRLWQSENTTDILPLIDLMQTMQPEITRQAKRALARLLPRLRQSDAPLLGLDARAYLHGVLNTARHAPGYDQELTIAVLRGLQQIGDAAALAYVIPLADKSGHGGQDPMISAAARECLTELEARCSQERFQQTYLRAATPPAAPTESLVRPASELVATAPSELLRPDGPSSP